MGTMISIPKRHLHLLLMVQLLSLPMQLFAQELTPYVNNPSAKFMVKGQVHSLSEYRGKKIMLWFFSTWCHSCAAGVKALADENKTLQKAQLTILALRNYQNNGYPGATAEDFIAHYSPSEKNNWLIGEASKAMDTSYNARHYPDIYFLIDEQGNIQEQGTAPAVFMQKIISFAQTKSNLERP